MFPGYRISSYCIKNYLTQLSAYIFFLCSILEFMHILVYPSSFLFSLKYDIPKCTQTYVDGNMANV